MIGVVSKDGGDTDQVAEGHEAEDEEQEEGEAGHGGGGVTGSSRQLLDTSASKSSIRRFVIRAFSWLKAATTTFTFKTLLDTMLNGH